MSIITQYLQWLGHDAGGALPPEDVLVGILTDGVWPLTPLSPTNSNPIRRQPGTIGTKSGREGDNRSPT